MTQFLCHRKSPFLQLQHLGSRLVASTFGCSLPACWTIGGSSLPFWLCRLWSGHLLPICNAEHQSALSLLLARQGKPIPQSVLQIVRTITVIGEIANGNAIFLASTSRCSRRWACSRNPQQQRHARPRLLLFCNSCRLLFSTKQAIKSLLELNAI